MTDFPALLSLAEANPLIFSETQRKHLAAVISQDGNMRAASRALGCAYNAVAQSVGLVKRKAALMGHSPEHQMVHVVPDPFTVKRLSTNYASDGSVAQQWVIAEPDKEKQAQAMRAVVEAMAGEIPRLDPIERPALTNDKLCNLYTLTDSHVGMLAWREEGGADWDLKIAERTLVGCFEHMVMNAPRAKVAVINQLGDFLHSDGLLPVTPTSGHILDQDGRFSKMVQVAIRVLRRVIDVALMRHDDVHLLLAEGNHDMASSVWLRHMFAALYENEPRLTVNASELPYYVHQHGKTMLAFHHGHLKKNDQLPILFASQFPQMWGATEKRYAHCGHRHHVEEKEHNGMTVVQHPTLAARDAYAARGGWVAERQATAMTYHAEYGLVARNSVTPEMLEAA